MYGLVLEGGGTKGIYHVGVMRALEDLKIKPTCVVGTSIGSVNGALFAQGELAKSEELWSRISLLDIISAPDDMPDTDNLFDIKNLFSFFSQMKKGGGIDVTPLEKILREIIDEDKIRKSKIDFGLVTYCLSGLKEQKMFVSDIPKGQLVDYILASSCLPVFKHRDIDKKRFIDGGVVNNLPIDMLIEKNKRNIISVEVGGIGISKRESGAGCNIVHVKMGEGAVGTLDFDRNHLDCAEKLGYFDTLKAFGKVVGDRYYFDTSDYYSARKKYSEATLSGVQKAAAYLKINRFCKYKVEKLISEVVTKYKSVPRRDDFLQILKWSDEEKLSRLADAILFGETELLSSKTVSDILGDIFEAASAVAYFAKK